MKKTARQQIEAAIEDKGWTYVHKGCSEIHVMKNNQHVNFEFDIRDGLQFAYRKPSGETLHRSAKGKLDTALKWLKEGST